MHVPTLLAAPDKFRGTLSSRQAAEAIAAGARAAGWECELAPVSDGGEGFIDAFADAARDRYTTVLGPLGNPTRARWALWSPPGGGAVAVVESAQAAGIALAGGAERNDPVGASTRGVGQLLLAAFAEGAGEVLVGVGGSATTDGGLGAVEALGRLAGRLPAPVTVACDVTTRFIDAASVFGPQKGATAAQVEFLQRRLQHLAEMYRERFHLDVTGLAGGGAAGGLAGGLAAAGAKLVPGFEVVAEHLGLAERIAGADLVVTGEGYLDAQSFQGKAVGGVCQLAARAGVPVAVVAGDAEDDLLDGPMRLSLSRQMGRERSFADAATCLSTVVETLLGQFATG